MTNPYAIRHAARRYNRRTLLQGTAVAAIACGAGAIARSPSRARVRNASSASPKRVIIIGFDGMDPQLSENLMNTGRLPHLARLRARQGYRRLGTSIPPQSPVAWANFINGAGPGSHGIFDFIHRHPHEQCAPFFSAAETLPGEGGWNIGDYTVPLEFWPFHHKPPQTVLRRQGTPFWDYLDAAKIDTTFYDLPSNYPPSPSQYGYHRCICGMGTPDLLGTYGTYQHYADDGPIDTVDEGGGKRYGLAFRQETARALITGPDNSFLKHPRPISIELLVHRDRAAKAAAIEIQRTKLLLREGEWSDWIRLEFPVSTPAFLPDKTVTGICRLFLQQVTPRFRLYVTPINIDPSNPALRISEPAGFVEEVSRELGLFYTTGFQEDHKALANGAFTDEQFIRQAETVLEERLKLFDYALRNYDDGLLFFYFSSTDLQSHMLWWDSDAKHPTRSSAEAERCFKHVHALYQRLDALIGDVLRRFDDRAAIFILSDHGFGNFARQFNLNTWLRTEGYLGQPDCTSILRDVDWPRTRAYGLGINGLYLNLKGRERDGIVEPGEEREQLLNELVQKLEAVRDAGGQQVIRRVHRTDRAYSGDATALAPDLVVGYSRGYRASWSTCLGDLSEKVLYDNDSAWSADHCADAREVPGVLFCNREIRHASPYLIDLAPTILAEFGLPTPSTMKGRSVFAG